MRLIPKQNPIWGAIPYRLVIYFTEGFTIEHVQPALQKDISCFNKLYLDSFA